jgi:hypothetical protein
MAQHLRLTNLGCLLRRKRLLRDRLRSLALSAGVADFLADIYRDGTSFLGDFRDNFGEDDLRCLVAFGLVDIIKVDDLELEDLRKQTRRSYRNNLHFLVGLNFELTYDCRLQCDHCLQSSIRNEYAGVRLAEGCVKDAIDQARFAGIVSAGVNFTGGEPFQATVDLFDLIAHATKGGVRTRLNTSADWGHGGPVRVSGEEFPHPESVVQRLLECGLDVLAISADRRLIQRPSLVDCVSNVANACARLGLPFQMVATGVKSDEETVLISRLSERMGDAFEQAGTIVRMDEVDLGRAADQLPETKLDPDVPMFDVGATECGGKGFFRPRFLHVSPRGELRSCLYGIGLSHLGKIPEDTLFAVVNRIGHEPVGRAFRTGNVANWGDRLWKTHSRLYRPVRHPCTACVVAAALIEGFHALASGRGGGEPSPEEIRELNRTIARKLNLLRPESNRDQHARGCP